MKYGFTRIAAAVPAISVADNNGNAESIIRLYDKALEDNAEIALFPELCITSHSCGDLFSNSHFIEKNIAALVHISASTAGKECIAVVGTPIPYRNSLYNCAAVIYNGNIVALVPKRILDGRNCEQRWFANGKELPKNATVSIGGKEIPFTANGIFSTGHYSFCIEVGSEGEAPVSPATEAIKGGATIILNLANGEAAAGKDKNVKEFLKQKSRAHRCICAYASSGWGESTSKAAHSGYCDISECGETIAENQRFQTTEQLTICDADTEKCRTLRRGEEFFAGQSEATEIHIPQATLEGKRIMRTFSPTPFIPQEEERDWQFEEIFTIQATALARRIAHTHSKCCVIGISGGLDSTLALLVTAKACDMLGRPHSDIIAVTMPGFGTTGRTYFNAMKLMKHIGATVKEISIKDACLQHFKDIEHDIDCHDITYENAQARERTQILMDIANKAGGIVVGTGDLSELALGWATFNGDHMSMYSVNASVPKTLMQHIVLWIAASSKDDAVRTTLLDIADTPISPELVPADEKGNIKQKTEDLVGPYELHDFFLYHFVRYRFSPEKIFAMARNAFDGIYDSVTIKKWMTTFFRRFFTQQFKRSCTPDSPKTGCCNLSPQGGWLMPSDTNGRLWTDACENIKP